MEQDNRESWLNRVAAGMGSLFETLDAPLPQRVRVAIGFTSTGRKGKAIGECWDVPFEKIDEDALARLEHRAERLMLERPVGGIDK